MPWTPEILAQYPPADLSIDGVGDLLTCELPALIQAGRPAEPSTHPVRTHS